MDGGWFIGRLQSHPEIAAEAETLEELHASIGRAFELMNRPHSESRPEGSTFAQIVKGIEEPTTMQASVQALDIALT